MVIDAGYDGPLSRIEQWAGSVEQHGLVDGIWVNDTTNDPFLLAHAVTRATGKVTVGTNIAVAFCRSPYCVAQTSYNLSELSGGRFVLGLGTQVKPHIERRFSMEWPRKPVSALVEYVALLRHLFECFQTRRRPNFKGDFFDCTLNSPVFTPDHHECGTPRVGISAVGPRMTEAAGRIAEVVFLHPFTHLEYLKSVTLPALERGKAFRDPALGELEIVGSCFCLATDAPDYEKRRREMLGRLAFYASTPNYEPVFSTLGMQELHTELHRLSRKGEWKEMAGALPPEFVEACSVCAPARELVGALHERFRSVYHRVVIDCSHLPSI